MAVNPLTPGVYIDEISVFPPSVAPVATAIPAFIGYTEKGPALTPTRITSMLEYEQTFGGAFDEVFGAGVELNPTAPLVNVNPTAADLSEYTLHYNLRMYFANGGGPCWIVSADTYDNTNFIIDWTKFQDGIAATERVDEVTLLVVPEAISSQVNPSQRSTLHSDMLDLCNKLKDRFSIMDVVVDSSQTIFQDAADFRDNEVGNNNLKYGAAYYPALDTLLTRSYIDSDIAIIDNRPTANSGPFDGKKLSDILNGITASGKVVVSNTISGLETVTIGTVTFKAVTGPPGPSTATTSDFQIGLAPIATNTAINLKAAINAHAVTSLIVVASISTTTNEVIITAKVAGSTGNSIAFTDSNDADLVATPVRSP